MLRQLGLRKLTRGVLEFGCGYGTFTIPAAKICSSLIYAIDIDSDMTELTNDRAREAGLENVRATVQDFVANGSGLADESVEFAMLFNILHIEDPVGLFSESKRVLKPSGTVAVIHWRNDIETPRGPSTEIRPSIQQSLQWGLSAGLKFEREAVFCCCDWHWGLELSELFSLNWNDFIGGTIVQQHRAMLTLGRRDTKLYCMRDKLLVLLMCCQVLMCPALCVAKCAHAAVAPCSQKAESACPCCGQQGSTDNNRCEDSPEEKGDSPNRPTQPEDCPDCFCSGTLVIGKEVATDLDFSPISHALATVEYSDIAQSLLIPVLDRTSSPRLIYGRFLLCTYGVLLI